MRGAGLFAVGEGEILIRAVLLQIVVILIAARVAAAVVRRLGQPAVVGEFLAGLALGPSFLDGGSRSGSLPYFILPSQG
jgi:Kef-type K+ transport system membrane component KefB